MADVLNPFSVEFYRLFTDFRYTAYRLETRQHYAVPYEEESFHHFLMGRNRPDDPEKRRWVAIIRDATRSGKQMHRVHVVSEPLSEYVRFELSWSYDDNVQAGEDIRIIPTREDKWPAELVRHDYWLFDSQRLVVMRYDNGGVLLAADLVDDSAEVVRHNYWRDVALHSAIRYKDYVPGRRDLRLAHLV